MEIDLIELPTEKIPNQFSSSVAVIFSCLGCVIGTGNLWRFPRIVARNSGNEGAAAFLIVWFVCLFIWSIPLIVVEYAVGRFCRTAPIRIFPYFLGKIGIFFGGWVTFINFFIVSYYLVIVSWCFYYIYLSISKSLPEDEIESHKEFDYLVSSKWTFVPYAICLLIVAASIIGGIKVIEKVNIVLVPILLTLLLGIFFYTVTLTNSEYGFNFLFSIDFETLKNPSVYLDAISQNAFDTGAASSLITAYAMYLTRKNSIIRYSIFIPIVNNAVSLICAMTIFPTVFGTMIHSFPTATQSEIVKVLKEGGIAGTGLSFIWFPILMNSMGIFGRILCVIFFICLSFAGISSVLCFFELLVVTLKEFGLRRKVALAFVCLGVFAFSCGSILNLNFLANQDYVWGFSLIIAGIFYVLLVYVFGPMKFKEEIVNATKSSRDFTLRFVWVVLITVVTPIEAVAVLIWWIYSEISANPATWYNPHWMSLITTWIEWIVFALILVIVNLIAVKVNIPWIKDRTIRNKNCIVNISPDVYVGNDERETHFQLDSPLDESIHRRSTFLNESFIYDDCVSPIGTNF